MSVDRVQRDLLVATIDRYLNDELTAFAFDDAIFAIREQTGDKTIHHVVDELWCYYDDCDDHKVVLNRLSWKYFQRLRLLLMSEEELDVSKKRIWTLAQVVAALGIVGFVWAASKMGVGEQLLVVTIPFGLVSIALSKWRMYLFRAGCEQDVLLTPFGSIPQLLQVRRRVSRFYRQPYPSHLASRRIRDAVGTLANGLIVYPIWLMLSPIVLLVQLLPVTIRIQKVSA